MVTATNFTQLAGAPLELQVTATQAPNITVTNLTLADQLLVGEAGAFTPGSSYTYAGAIAWTTLTGDFTGTSSVSPLFTATLIEGANSDTIVLNALPVGSIPGLTTNQQSLIAAAEEAGLTPLYSLNGNQLNSVLASVSGEQNTQNFQFSVNEWQQFTSLLLNRLFSGGGGGGGTTGELQPGPGHPVRGGGPACQQVAQTSDGASGLRTSAPTQWGVWARGYGTTAQAPSTSSSNAYNESGAGLILGADKQMSDKLVAGFAVNIATDTATISGRRPEQDRQLPGLGLRQVRGRPELVRGGDGGLWLAEL